MIKLYYYKTVADDSFSIIDELEYRGQLDECEHEYKDIEGGDVINLPFSPSELVEVGYTMVEVEDT